MKNLTSKIEMLKNAIDAATRDGLPLEVAHLEETLAIIEEMIAMST